RYDDRAEIYARGRPSYPAEAIEHVARPNERVLDLGAGTGIGTRLLAARGLYVVAVDGNVAMLDIARPAMAAAARAEVLPFRTASVDLVTAFNAFHWFQPEPFFEEARRVLRPDGRLALLWNDWDAGDAFTAAFVRLMRSRAGDFPPEDREGEVAPLYATARFADVQRTAFPNTHILDLPTLRLRLQSMSYIPKAGPAWDALNDELTALFAAFADKHGCVRHRYETSVFVARRMD
ncbi:MAG TPA: class I SAM-dependent methyltransferase, partial [Thermoanaerobaculia bacterium]|nr:class I SAM-dependent methyltransferase [Thermoanaerobaculia bacterium]